MGLSSSFGGDLRASTVVNRLLSRRFCDDIRVPELAHISPRGEHDAIRAHRARHPCVVGRPPLARTRSRHKAQHGARVGRVRILRACPHGDQEPSARRPPNLLADGFCSKCPAHAEKPKNGSIEGRSEADRSLQRLGASRPRARRRLTAPSTGESSHRSSRHHGAASMPLDPPPGTDPTTRLAAQQPQFTPKRRGVPNMESLACADLGCADRAYRHSSWPCSPTRSAARRNRGRRVARVDPGRNRIAVPVDNPEA